MIELLIAKDNLATDRCRRFIRSSELDALGEF
jgi:hypothetical protein